MLLTVKPVILVILQPLLRAPAGQTEECNFAGVFFLGIYLLLKPEALSIFKCSRCHHHMHWQGNVR